MFLSDEARKNVAKLLTKVTRIHDAKFRLANMSSLSPVVTVGAIEVSISHELTKTVLEMEREETVAKLKEYGIECS